MADEETHIDSVRIGLVLGGVGLLMGAWTTWFAASPGVVMKPDLSYDFIVVGGGTAGCVVASRLSEVPSFRVLLIEAGGEEPWASYIPLAAPLFQNSKNDWQYRTLPQKHSMKSLRNQESFWPRGKVLGGSGQINFNIHTYGSPQDFDLWESDYGAKGWGFEAMKKYSNKAECLRLRPKLFKESKEQCSMSSEESAPCSENASQNDHRRKKQDAVQCYEPSLRKIKSNSELSKAFLKAGAELGLPVGNLNDDIDYGVMEAESNIYKGKRWSTVSGYLRPAMTQRKNIHVLINTQVTKIVWDGRRAVGVEYIQHDNPLMNGTVFARGEVILSAGAINSPQLLVHSGIGPRDTLQKLGISPMISSLEGVGQNLQDHLNIPLYVSLRTPVSLNLAKLRSPFTIWDYFVHGKGDLARSAIEGVASSPVNGDRAEVGLILFNMGAVDKSLYSTIANIKPELFESMFPGMHNDSSEGFVFLASCLHPRSRGKLIFRDLNPREPPLIQPNYLQHPYDLTCMRDAFRLSVKMAKTRAFEDLGASLHFPNFPGCNFRPDQDLSFSHTEYQEYLSCIIRSSSITGYHPTGTARIGREGEAMAVVDSELRVKGVQKLRVVDASVMPTLISGAPNSAVILIAEKASDMIKEVWGDGKMLKNEKICSTSSDCEEIIFNRLANHAHRSSTPKFQKIEIYLLSIMIFLVI